MSGVIELAGAAVAQGDARALYPLIDRRARSAMSSIAADLVAAAALVRADYHEPERSAELAALGPIPASGEGQALFVQRCGGPCLAELGALLGVPDSERALGEELVVRTRRGTELRLFRDREGRLGLVWNTEALAAERLQTNRALAQVRQNAETYRRRRALEAGAGQDLPTLAP